MQNPLQITFHDLKHDAELEKIIHEKFDKLKPARAEITKCHVSLEKQSKHHTKANLARVRLDLKVAHFDDVVVTEDCREDHASLKTAVLKVFKSGLVLMREEMKRRQDHKGTPLREKFAEEEDESEENVVI